MTGSTWSPSYAAASLLFILLTAPLLLLAASCAHEPPNSPLDWPLACGFYPREADDVPACARSEADGEFVIRTSAFPSDSEPGRVHAIFVEGELLFALASGKTAPTLVFDNGPDYFVEGLARTVRDSKVGFVNKRLELVVPRAWDFAFPFEKGIARVCTGCASVRLPPDEHSEVQGGLWGYIDRAGRIVVPVEHARDSLPEPPAGVLVEQAGLGRLGGMATAPPEPGKKPSWRYAVRRSLLPIGIFLMSMAILGFLGFSALFLPPLAAWFIYLFLLPFLAWIPAMILHPAAGWPVAGAWLVAFPLLRRWAVTTPGGKSLGERYYQWWARFGSGDPVSGSWTFPRSGHSRGSSSSSQSRGTSDLSGRGGRFGGGGASGRW